jgi:hypothetical protein
MAIMKPFRALVRHLRDQHAPILPVECVIRHKPESPYLGSCRLSRSRNGKPLKFVIEIHDGASWSYLRLIVLHEWAHALAWSEEAHDSIRDHGPEWALAYSRLYQSSIEP